MKNKYSDVDLSNLTNEKLKNNNLLFTLFEELYPSMLYMVSDYAIKEKEDIDFILNLDILENEKQDKINDYHDTKVKYNFNEDFDKIKIKNLDDSFIEKIKCDMNQFKYIELCENYYDSDQYPIDFSVWQEIEGYDYGWMWKNNAKHDINTSIINRINELLLKDNELYSDFLCLYVENNVKEYNKIKIYNIIKINKERNKRFDICITLSNNELF